MQHLLLDVTDGRGNCGGLQQDSLSISLSASLQSADEKVALVCQTRVGGGGCPVFVPGFVCLCEGRSENGEDCV